MNPRDRLIVALDVPSLDQAQFLVGRLGDAVGSYKVGLELYAAAGPTVLKALLPSRLFLDLKLHDIPETVGRTVEALGSTGASWLSVHTSGGSEMMRRAAQAAHKSGIKVLGVTVLTSLAEADLEAIGDNGSIEELVTRRARLAEAAGCDGVVASVKEAARVRAACGPGFLIVTPGIRPTGGEKGDQKRVATAREAISAGADLVVVGRPIRDAADPRAAVEALLEEIASA